MGFLGKGLSGRRVGLGNIAAAWSPIDASIPALSWYRPDLGLTESGGFVTGWADQSGQGDANRDQIASGADRPGYVSSDAGYGNKPVLTFDGSQFLQSGGAWSSSPDHPITIVIVGQAAASGAILCERTGGSPYNLLWVTGSGKIDFYTYADVTSTSSVTSPSVMMLTDDETDAKVYVGDLTTAQSTASSLIGTGTGFDIGLTCAGVTPMVGKLAEIIIFGGMLTPTDKVNLADYLNNTRIYGLGVTV